jgi:hypothetical protein
MYTLMAILTLKMKELPSQARIDAGLQVKLSYDLDL